MCNRNFRDFVFRVLPPLRYEDLEEYKNFKQSHPDIEPQSADEQRLQQLSKKYQEEKLQNKATIQKKRGEVIFYGDEIMLQHYDSGEIIEASKTCAEIDKSCNLLRTVPSGSAWVYFIIEPKYKYRSEGQVVTYGDVCIFKNTMSKYYMHVSEHSGAVQMPDC